MAALVPETGVHPGNISLEASKARSRSIRDNPRFAVDDNSRQPSAFVKALAHVN